MQFEVEIDTPSEFFAPVSSDVFNTLIGEYNATRAKIIELADVATGHAFSTAMAYFIEGNAGDERMHRSLYVDKLFQVDGAIKALNASYWRRALNLTDAYELMPQKRRDEWDKDIREGNMPDFTEDAVRPTILNLLNMRAQFLAEKVDGVFRGLSGHHVTNRPEGFSIRMIISYVLNSWGHTCTTRGGLIHDLRCVISRFMGRGEPHRRLTIDFLEQTRRTPGQWVSTDGGALRVRMYKNGNAHLEVHPDMAWRLNCVLAHMHPSAIPSEFRKKPKKKPKEFEQLLRPLPFPVLEIISQCLYHVRPDAQHVWFNSEAAASPHLEEAKRVLESIGGVRDSRPTHQMNFDYPVHQILREIVATGVLPDSVSFQFHQTSERLAYDAAEWAEIGDEDEVLEPSAGQGAIAKHLPADSLQCIELSALHCQILKAKGFRTEQADFIAWAEDAAEHGRKFNVIVMNPPFADGRAALHIEYAYSLLAQGGRLVAVMPGSYRNKQIIPNVEAEFSRIYENEFTTTSVSVVLMRVRRPIDAHSQTVKSVAMEVTA
ncbi:putative RNA methylase [Paraburkholderia sp. GAS448]|uniref:DUF4942 domain-containing protein n=1 Tax=Paraburkholderia sp. GAS448 TaxID=3035136 RepID=UPI003D1F825D